MTTKNLIGKKYGMLTVIEMLEERSHGHIQWRCVCECGVEVITRGAYLKRGEKKSCGQHGLSSGEAAFNNLFNVYLHGARQRGLTFELTKEQFAALTKQTCHYCGSSPMQERILSQCNGSYMYNGIDRIDNDQGYVIDNVVPCCGFCNKAKGKKTYQEFTDWLNKLVEFRKGAP